eukprot:CAMPEP_0174250004 /NCGR_PEP_ID=MMETSP0439-20130205/310_1 /TAXON_ID=0 /ORGANISM="Stereomyxa ramosa, Strain Chinc5" /LENGTH=257 /DNA_ID=CAMNT_0015329961 /DNA_START=1926 /DNA_END=2695 /DNA_ORIENTATION=+
MGRDLVVLKGRKNYKQWRHRIQAKLEEKDLYLKDQMKPVEDTFQPEPEPDSETDTEKAAREKRDFANKRDVESHNREVRREIKEWEAKNRKAVGMIKGSVDDRYSELVAGITDSVDMLDLLQTQFGGEDTSTTMHLLLKLMKTRKHEGQTMDLYIRKVLDIVTKLEKVDFDGDTINIPSPLVSAILLFGLRTHEEQNLEYKPLVDTLMITDKALDLDETMQKMTSFELTLEPNKQQANYTGYQNGYRGRGRGRGGSG